MKLLCAVAAAVVVSCPVVAGPLRFELSYDPAITDAFTGRVYVMLSTRGREPDAAHV